MTSYQRKTAKSRDNGNYNAKNKCNHGKLSYEEQSMLAQHFGFCLNCKSVFYMDYKDLDEYGEPKKKQIPKMMYTDIATDHEYSSANTAKKICEKSIEKLKEMLESMGV